MLDARGKAVSVQPVNFTPDAESFAGSLRRRYALPLRACVQAVELVPFWERVGTIRTARGWLEKKRRGVEKVLSLAKLYSTYTLNAWSFETSNSRALMASLSEADQARFPYFPDKSWDWGEFWSEKHIPGMRRWVLHEKTPQVTHQPSSKL